MQSFKTCLLVRLVIRSGFLSAPRSSLWPVCIAHPAGHTFLGEAHRLFCETGRCGMRTFGLAQLDRRWFRAHPERRHRCRWPDAVELDPCDNDRDGWLVMAIRHLGRGHVVYQPVKFQGALPRDERSAAALFALAATSSEPIPVIALLDVLRLRRGLCQALRPEPIHTGCNGSLAAPAGPNGR
jgi:hypothetical protein